jgi:hypothetical protein
MRCFGRFELAFVCGKFLLVAEIFFVKIIFDQFFLNCKKLRKNHHFLHIVQASNQDI